MTGRNPRWLTLGVIGSAAFYHPLTLIATNAWEISSTVKPILIGCLTAVTSFLIAIPIARRTGNRIASAVTVAAFVLLFMNWRAIDTPILASGTFILFVFLVMRSGPAFLQFTAYVLVAFFGLGSLASVAVSHSNDSKQYPVAPSTTTNQVEATGEVEDFLLLVVDQYPSIGLAESWLAMMVRNCARLWWMPTSRS